ncbi:MAG: mechanosensitive ion channel family protein [Bacteroidetes bacterium]|nr:mechanosensitive ion channel family protein [Bacteroidota bacterium]MBU1371715.1 mechanosensitive ion channel family protein [Bacteroidota bacterium]MBU1483720.1 mechanosensitive ion channel family protein [Bacteroidota bacterium]MBU1761204.1 mechanosensitive ion channel family protein [Bacteroidota bacterium]MBU2046182.1 mechanosensitive ion channel family protein [Bacteroidota bacterium]
MNLNFLDQVYWGNSIKSYILFFGIILLALIFKKLFSKIISRLIFTFFLRYSKEVKVDKFLELLLKPIEFLIGVIIIYIAINQLTYPLNLVIFKRTVEKVAYTITIIEVIDKIFLTLIIISGFRILLRIIDFMSHIFAYKASLTDSKTDDQLVPFMRELTKIVTIILAVFVVMGAVFNMNVATIIAGLGIGGLAIALAAQDTLQNLLGSFTIFADKPFVVGDLVHVADYDAVVEKVGFRSTTVRTLDKTLVIIPNKKMIDSPLENLTLRNLRRVKFSVGVLYGTPATTIKKIAKEIKAYLDEHHETSMDAIVVFDAFGASSLDILILYYIEIVDYDIYMKIKEEINYKVMEIVLNNGADFAFPSRTLYHEFGDQGIPLSKS